MITTIQTLLILLLLEPIFLYLLYFKRTKKRNPLLEFYMIVCYTVLGFSLFAAIIFQDVITLLTSQLLTTTAIFFLGTTNIIMLLAVVIIYKKTEDQRISITKLTREITYLKEKTKKR